MSGILQSTVNYLVPAAGTTNAYTVSYPSNGDSINFGQITSISGTQFTPSGVMVDNTQGSSGVVIVIEPLGFSMLCPAGKQLGMQYPAMMDQRAVITGGESAILTFVDFPVIPYLF